MTQKTEETILRRVLSLLDEREKYTLKSVEDIKEGKKEKIVRRFNAQIEEASEILHLLSSNGKVYSEELLNINYQSVYGCWNKKETYFTVLLSQDKKGKWDFACSELKLPKNLFFESIYLPEF